MIAREEALRKQEKAQEDKEKEDKEVHISFYFDVREISPSRSLRYNFSKISTQSPS